MDLERIAELRARFNRPCDVEDDDMIPERIGRELLAALEAANAALAAVQAERDAGEPVAWAYMRRLGHNEFCREATLSDPTGSGAFDVAPLYSRLSPVPSRDAGGA